MSTFDKFMAILAFVGSVCCAVALYDSVVRHDYVWAGVMVLCLGINASSFMRRI